METKIKAFYKLQYKPREDFLMKQINEKQQKMFKNATLSKKMSVIDNMQAQGLFW